MVSPGTSLTPRDPTRARTWVASAMALLSLLFGCVLAPQPRVAPQQMAPDGLSTTGTDTVRVVGVTTKDYAYWRFDSTPAPRMAGDTVVARVCGAPLAVRLRSVATLWVARPGELARPVAKADVRHALAVGREGSYVAPGSRVLLWAPSADMDAQVATLVRVSADSIVVARGPARGAGNAGAADSLSSRVSLVPDSVRRLQRSLGWTRWPGVRTGLKVGAAIGGLAGVIGVANILTNNRPCDRRISGDWCDLHDIGVAFAVIALPAAGALAGGLAGGVVGALFVTERWEDVPLNLARQRCAASAAAQPTP